jgi:hypothetical protein
MRFAPTAGLAALLGVLGTAVAHAIPPVTVFGLRFPEEVAGFTLNDSTNLERATPGQGYSLDYSLPGWKLDVFVYDLKRAAIPDDARSAIVRAEFERSREDAFLSAPRGPFAQVYLRRNFTIEDGKKLTRFQCAAFHMRRDGAKPQDGFLCVTALRNKFVKLRLTTLAHQGTETQARQHVAAWIPVLWGGANAASAAAAPAAKAAPARRAQPQRRPPQQRRPQPR